MKKPEIFTESQWILCRKYSAIKMLSIICANFGSQFVMLYIMQNITIEAKALQSIATTVTGMASAILILLPWMMKHLDKLLLPITWLLAIISIIADLMVLQYPILILFIMATLFGLLSYFIEGGFDTLINMIYQGKARTFFTFSINRATAIGTAVASVFCYICASVDLKYIIIVDIILTIVDVVLISTRVHWLKKEIVSQQDF